MQIYEAPLIQRARLMEMKIKITDETEFDYWYSQTKESLENNTRLVNGRPYSERILKGKIPTLKSKFPDLELIATLKNKEVNN